MTGDVRRFDAARWGWISTAIHAFLTLVSIGAFAVMIGRPIPTTADPDWWRASYQWGMTYMGALVLVLGFFGALFALWDAAGARPALRAAGWVVAFTLTIELIGAATGLPFGEHAYGDDLGWRVLGLVPFTIPLSWFLMLYATTGLALRAGMGWRGTAILATVGLLAYDVLLEPAMSAAYPFWIWREGGTWHGMPIANWLAWATIGPLIGWMMHRAAGASLARIARTRQPDLIYLVNGLLPLAMAVRYELYGAAIVGGGGDGVLRRGAGRDQLGTPPAGRHARGGGRRVSGGPALPASGPWRARILAWASSARWQAWASAFPLTRPFARRASRRVFDLCAGFVYSQVLLAVVRLRLLEQLADGPRSAEELATALALPADSTDRLLSAAGALDLLRRRRDGRWDIGPLGMALVGREDFRVLFEHNLLLYRDLVDPVALLRAGRRDDTALAQFWPYALSATPEAVPADAAAAYSAVMAASQPQVAAEALAAYDVSRHRRLLDVGGGEGVFLQEAAGRAPQLQLHLFDLPAVAARGRTRLGDAGLADRLTVTGGDFFRDPLPTGADLVSLVRVLHDHDDGPVEGLLRRVHEVLPPGGRLLVVEPMAGVPGAEAVGEAYFALYLLAMGSGRARTPAEYSAMLTRAGFANIRIHPVRSPIRTGVITATKPD